MYMLHQLCILYIYLYLYIHMLRRPKKLGRNRRMHNFLFQSIKKNLKDGPFGNQGFTGVATAIYVHKEFTGLNPNGSHFLSHDQHR